MTILSASEASQCLDRLIDALADSHDIVHISSHHHGAILVSEAYWQAIEETLHLASIPGMKESIIEGLHTPVEDCQ